MIAATYALAGSLATNTDPAGAPIAGATVQINAANDSGQVAYRTRTDANGHYQWWLDPKYNPFEVSAAKDGYQPQVKRKKVTERTITELDFTLRGA